MLIHFLNDPDHPDGPGCCKKDGPILQLSSSSKENGCICLFENFTLYYQVWSYLHSTFGGSPAVTKLQACQYCLAAAHAEQVVISKPLEVLQILTR